MALINKCLECGKKFTTYPCKIKTGRGKFCTKRCCDLWKMEDVVCNFCKRIFAHSVRESRNRKFCSRKCKMSGSFGDRVREWVKHRYEHGNPFIGQIRKSIRGDRHPNWQGGKTNKLKMLRNSTEYKLWRVAVFERDGYKCVWCGSSKSGNLEADHIKPFAIFPDLRFAIDNGRTLCKDCHKKTDTYLKQSLKKLSAGK